MRLEPSMLIMMSCSGKIYRIANVTRDCTCLLDCDYDRIHVLESDRPVQLTFL